MVCGAESRTCIEQKLVSNGKHIPEPLEFHNKEFGVCSVLGQQTRRLSLLEML
jgi:hypothetical protein